jgi:transitional endoplasmic reticulum ATPase
MVTEKPIKLKVQEAMQDDVNKGIVRIDSALMREMDIRPGNIVEIKGGRTTVAIADRSLPGDIGLSIIRMDGLIRRNAKTSISEMVDIAKADVKEAKKVIIAPARKGIMIRANPLIFKQGLLGRAIMKGDIVSLGGTRRRRSTMVDNPFFEDMFSMLDDTMMGFGLGDLKFIVVDTLPKSGVLITENTQVEFKPEAVEVVEEKAIDISYEDVGGLEEEIKKIREMVELPLKHPEIFERLGIEAPKGVLLHGPPGTGKTLIAKAVANETNSNFFVINGPEIMSKFYGQSEENLRKKFEEAEKSAPSIIFIDEIDAIASKREESKGEVERRVVAQLLAIMDGLKSRGKVVVIAATNIPNSLDPALRRPGRFDREIEIGVPGKEGRLNILKIHTRNMPLFDINMALSEKQDIPKEYKDAMVLVLDAESDKTTFNVDTIEKKLQKFAKNGEKNELKNVDPTKLKKYFQDLIGDPRIVRLHDLSSITHGFVGADLAALARESAMIVLRRVLPDMKMEEEEALPKEVLEKLYLTQKDFFDALKVVRPSALREVLIEVPNVHWDDIGGLEEVKQQLKEAVEWPLKHPEIFTRMGIRPPRGILLYGAPGTGKTLLAKAVAKETEANFISVKGPELLSKWVGESEKAVREIFKKARQASPTIVFFDEIDSIAPRRGQSEDSHVTERVVNQLLTEMDGLQMLNDIVIVAATNRPDIMDTALLRPGRFDRIILTPVPDVNTRKLIFKIHLKNVPLEEENTTTVKATATQEPAKKTKTRKTKKKAVEEKPTEQLPVIENSGVRDNLINELAKRTEGYVGADIEAICREAAIIALRDSNLKANKVSMKNFEKALEIVRPSASKEIEKAYEGLEEHFRTAKAKEMEAEKPSYYG